MKNNKGFGTFEILAVIALALAIFAFLGYVILGGANKTKFNTMKETAYSFSKAVATNIASFHYTNTVYLGEAVEEGFFKDVKNPFGKGNCDDGESRIDFINGKPYATFKCGKYLINETSFDDATVIPFYEVSDWDTKKLEGKDTEKKTLYNCLENGKEVFDEYEEELYFIFEYNKKYGTDAYFAKDVLEENCEVATKDFYRTIKEVK